MNNDDPFPEWDALVAPSTGGLSARAQPLAQGQQGPCLLAPNAGYRRLENQLYRVEVHKGGALGVTGQQAPTFKWSRDNGTVVTSIEKFNGQELTLHDTGRDEVLGFAAGQLVEVVDDAQELSGSPGQLFTITKVNAATRIATLSGAPAVVDASRHPRLRRWDSASEMPVSIPGTNDGFIPLEDGVRDQVFERFVQDRRLLANPGAHGDCRCRVAVHRTAAGARHPASLRSPRLLAVERRRHAAAAAGCAGVSSCPLTPTPLALHVKGINWPNDDFVVLETLTQGNVGLRILLDSTFNPNTVNSSTMVVTLETVLPATPPKPNSFLHVDTVLAGQITLDPLGASQSRSGNDPHDRVEAAARFRRSERAAGSEPSTRHGFASGSMAVQYGATTAPGCDISTDTPTGRPGQRADDKSFRVDLGLPTGTDALASDFESWFFLKKIIPPATLIALTLTPEKSSPAGPSRQWCSSTALRWPTLSIASLSNSNPEAPLRYLHRSSSRPERTSAQLQLTTAANLGATTAGQDRCGRLGSLRRHRAGSRSRSSASA